MTPVLSKPQMYRRLLAGEFGNRGECWFDLNEFWEATREHAESVRYAIRTLRPGGPFIQPLTRTVAMVKALQMREACNVSVCQPHEKLTIQGELDFGPGSFPPWPKLRYSYAKDCMRDAWKIHEANVAGLAARTLLKQHLDIDSYDRLMDLGEHYPGHVVEFSHYRVPVGVEPHRLVIWEIRKY